MEIKELHDILIRKYNFGLCVILVLSFIGHQDRHEICEFNDRHLVLIDLGVFNLHQFVANVVHQQEHAVGL